MSIKSACEVSDRNEEHVIGHWRKCVACDEVRKFDWIIFYDCMKVKFVSFEVGYLLEISKRNVEDETWFLLASFRKYVKYEKKEINWGKKLCQKKSALDELEISTYPENILWDRDKGVCEQLFAEEIRHVIYGSSQPSQQKPGLRMRLPRRVWV